MKSLDKLLQKQIFRGLYVLIILLAIVLAFYYVLPLVYPFLFGWVVALILNPLVNLLHTKVKLPRMLATLISLLIFCAVTLGILTALTINIVIEISSLADTIQNNINTWKDEIIVYINSDYIQNIVTQINVFYQDNEQLQDPINNALTNSTKIIAGLSSSIVNLVFNFIVNFITSLPSYATFAIIGLLAAFFISKDWYKLIKRFGGYFPDKIRESSHAIWGDLQRALFGYVRAQLILITTTATFVLIGLVILDVKYAITISLLIGLCDLMPYLGVGAFMVPWIIFLFIQGNIYYGIGVSVIYGIVLVVRQIIEPKVLATSVGLNALATLVSMFIGLKLFGVLGLIIGPVSLIVLTAFHNANVFKDIRDYVKGKSPIIEQ
ncbi:sporulation integral membrane protein YtvI [Paenibacillus psychroresistens]|uniref:Sporulation integral membrane protein YtvI n=1 Tax=Paenibacillus psychroresistens TaxID=1778678 RepID=A0A6B8RN75_9BACL|nr:sporulation integral membrane protein YtvI [Paenibacillus psychroresistens]QGQ97801.1 sporulation integral membrane protein YtvI [Paenibacillus psychroresistens]